MKHSRILCGLLAILGIVFLTLVLAGSYLDAADSVSILASLSLTKLGLWFFFSGIALVTVGTVGVVRQHFKNHRNLFTALAVLLIPSLTFATMFFVSVFVVLSAPMFPMRSEITQVTVVDTNPLVLSVDVKALTSRDSRIDGALILVTSSSQREWVVSNSFQGMAVALLPAASEITLTVDFNCTLPSGNYTIRLTGGMHDNHGSSLFTIP